jgi:6-phosphogluconate dehydrogenase (decarboxylating)
MQLGIVGLGRMGGNIARRLLLHDHECVPADVLAAALNVRFHSREQHAFAEKLLSAMRKGFGGHVEPGKKPAR